MLDPARSIISMIVSSSSGSCCCDWEEDGPGCGCWRESGLDPAVRQVDIAVKLGSADFSPEAQVLGRLIGAS